MYAVVEAGGRQYQLSSGRFVDVEMVSGEPESAYVFDRVLMIVDGKESVVGKPLVEGAKVSGKIVAHGRRAKLIVYKYRAKKGTRKRTGHRQGYTRIFIDSIKLNDKVLSEAKDAGKPKREKAEKTEAPKAKAKAAAAPEKKSAKAEKAAPKAEAKSTTAKKSTTPKKSK